MASDSSAIDVGARRIGDVLRAAGYRALLAGGCVRDLLLHRPPQDWDLVTDAPMEAVADLFEHTVDVGGRRFGILCILLEEGRYEVARLRREGGYRDGRRPEDVIYTDDPAADAARRDFTVNGMLYDLATDALIDVVGGQADLRGGIIRAIGDPARRFAEDHLRMLRAVRFASRLGFQIETATWASILDGAQAIRRVSAERIQQELTRILTEGGAARGLQMLLDSGLLAWILPEVAALPGVAQPPAFHPEGDVWQHVQSMLVEIDRLDGPDPALAWSVLLHDIGKPPTCRHTDRIRFHNHDVVGAEMADDIGRRLRMPKALRRRIVDLIRHHMRLRQAPQMRAGKLQRLLNEVFFPQLLELHRIDCLGSHGRLDLYDFCRQRLQAADAGGGLRRQRLITGDDLVALGYAPGPVFARILTWVEDEQAEGRLGDKAQALAAVARRFPR